jgi:hypothetical protein
MGRVAELFSRLERAGLLLLTQLGRFSGRRISLGLALLVAAVWLAFMVWVKLRLVFFRNPDQ